MDDTACRGLENPVGTRLACCLLDARLLAVTRSVTSLCQVKHGVHTPIPNIFHRAAAVICNERPHCSWHRGVSTLRGGLVGASSAQNGIFPSSIQLYLFIGVEIGEHAYPLVWRDCCRMSWLPRRQTIFRRVGGNPVRMVVLF